jgi:MYXO-CTERM domain-containing protein
MVSSALRRRGFFTLSLATLGLAIASGGDARAAIPTPTGFCLELSPSSFLLNAVDAHRDGDMSSADYYEIKYDEACDNPNVRIQARNKPAVMITNLEDSAAPITQLVLTINEGPYIFSDGDGGNSFTNFIKQTLYNDAGVTITGSSLSADMKSLTVTFDGLTAGKKAVFNIDLDTTDPSGFGQPDYRMVLFGAPLPGENATDPATATARFVSASSPLPNSKDLTVTFSQLTEEPQFANANVRPYREMDPMEVFKMQIPEPGAAIMALAGMAGIAVGRRRRR